MGSNRYVRAADGTTITVGQLQDDATAVNGLSADQPPHTHVQRATADFGGPPTIFAQNNGGPTKLNVDVSTASADPTITVSSTDTETRPISIAMIPYVRMVNRDVIVGRFKNGARVGDCKYSLLDHADFNAENAGNWVRLEGQSIAGTDLDSKYGIATLPDAVSNGAFFRQVGGNSAGLRAFQEDAIRNITGKYSGGRGLVVPTPSGAFGFDSVNNTAGPNNGQSSEINFNFDASRVVPTANENRPKNIALNFYCLVSE